LQDRPTNQQRLEQVADPEADVHEEATSQIEVARLRRELRALPSLERRILELRFGLEGSEQLTNRRVAERLCMSAGRVSYLERRALELLRSAYSRDQLLPLAGAA
jgi:RNA polymerase sigma factor (sigma-70 family)